MDRRTLLKLLATATLAGCGGRTLEAHNLRVVVAGAGIVGASIAYHLAKSGAVVTVIDKQGPATHASRGTFAWINATWAKQPQHYHALNQEGLAGWQALQQSLNLPIRWGGSLEWFTSEERSARLAAQIAEQVTWGEPARMVDAAAVAELEPNLTFDTRLRAAYSPNDGAVDPVLATQALLDAAVALGATVQYPAQLCGTTSANGRLLSVETDGGSIKADRLVLATGAAADLPARIAGVDVPQRSTPGIIAITKPMPRLINRVIVAPGVHMHQRDDGRIVLGEQDGAPNNAAHAARLAGRPNDFPAGNIAHEHGQRMLRAAVSVVPRMQGTQIDAAYIGWRPLPLDGHPVLGASPAMRDTYLAIMHSGVSLAPIVGQLAAQEIVTNTSLQGLAPYRPGRRFEDIKRY